MLLKGGLIVSPVAPGISRQNGKKSGLKRADVRITGGIISEIGDDLKARDGDEVLDIQDRWISPGFIDIHTHLRDLNQQGKETIASGTRAAAQGGYTTVVSMANTDPTTDSPNILTIVLDKIAREAVVRVLPVAAVTLGLKGEQLSEMVRLAELGAVAFSDDGMPLTNLGLLRQALQYGKLLDKVIISHPEDHSLTRGGCIHESHVSARLGLPGIPAVSESACIAREIELARATGGRIHFAHVSTVQSVELIKGAKADGLPVTAEVSPHHIALCDEDITGFDTRFKMNPPLRGKKDQEALVAALKEGVFDAIATDHAPHTAAEKSMPFAQAPFGIIGLETAFSVTYERLVLSNQLTINELIYLLTVGPAKVLKLPDPELKPGARADIAVIAPHQEWTYLAGKGSSRSSNSPFDGATLKSKVVVTIFDGTIVHKEHASAAVG